LQSAGFLGTIFLVALGELVAADNKLKRLQGPTNTKSTEFIYCPVEKFKLLFVVFNARHGGLTCRAVLYVEHY
jgi:hypothetical protein